MVFCLSASFTVYTVPKCVLTKLPKGRGIYGLTLCKSELLHHYQYCQKLPQLPHPCDVFDVAQVQGKLSAHSPPKLQSSWSPRRLIFILLFRLGMTGDEDITTSAVLSHKKSSTSLLEKAITKAIESSTRDKFRSLTLALLVLWLQRTFISNTLPWPHISHLVSQVIIALLWKLSRKQLLSQTRLDFC